MTMSERDRRNSWKATGWLFAWAVSFVGTTFAIGQEAIPAGPSTYLAIAASSALGLIAMLAYVRFVREADEFQRKIQLEAMALAFGGGFVGTFALTLLERAGALSVDPGDTFLVMVAFYLVGLFLGARRYA